MKTVIIMRGIPGSGKSTLVKQFIEQHKNVVVHSTDDYWVNDKGEYKFDIDKLHTAHKRNKAQFDKSITDGAEFIIVDNTNIRPKDYKPYIEMARANEYRVWAFVFEPNDLETHIDRNIHDAPVMTLGKMKNTLLQNFETAGVDWQYVIKSGLDINDIKLMDPSQIKAI